jgi:hypothetical protein
MSRGRKAKRPDKDKPRRARGGARPGKAAAILGALAVVCGGIAAALLLSGVIGGPPGPKTAAIVDQLSLTEPNPAFLETATSTLQQAGYAVDYYPGEEVTVEFYRNLPTHGYELIILRVHSGLVVERYIETGSQTATDYVGLFTSEPYSDTKYSTERLGRLGEFQYYDGSPTYFGIAPNFVRWTMRGGFDEATIILMGCDGLKSDETAEAFLEKGAKAFIGWNGSVSAAHTDAATERLLRHLLIDGLDIQQAVTQTMADVGPDPAYGSSLLLYPPEAAADGP